MVFAWFASVLQTASVRVFAAIRQYALAKPCEAKTPGRRRPNPTPLHFAMLCVTSALRGSTRDRNQCATSKQPQGLP